MQQKIVRFTWEEIDAIDLRALDLRDELEQIPSPVATLLGRVRFWDAEDRPVGEYAEVLFIPDNERGGISWGAPGGWTDARSLEEVIERYISGEMIE